MDTHFPRVHSRMSHMNTELQRSRLYYGLGWVTDAKWFPCCDPEVPCRLVPGWTWTGSGSCRSSDVYWHANIYVNASQLWKACCISYPIPKLCLGVLLCLVCRKKRRWSQWTERFKLSRVVCQTKPLRFAC